ncbi:MAG TPA: phage tail protein [Archangium sp.]|uniref:phage tail protein n=1 Tax=Archangium sp. TaxID=1872627 RepID=UPI002E2FF10F|nr:phage tail protein [Archangium sp.]HEX5749539.1 phage tail protein [Archangium sp.]
MDVNGTRYHLLLGRDDWGRCRQEGQALDERWKEREQRTPVRWDDERAALTLRPLLFRFTAPVSAPALDVDERRGAGRDQYGNIYWVDESRTSIRVQSSGTGKSSTFWSLEAPPLPRATTGDFGPVPVRQSTSRQLLSGLAVTPLHYLVAGSLEPAGLLVFDLHTGSPPLRFLWPSGVAFVPFDLSPTPEGGVLVLDREHRRCWTLDATFRVVRTGTRARPPPREALFHPVGPEPVGTQDAPSPIVPELSEEDAFLLEEVDPIAVEALPDGQVLVLDRRAEPEASHLRLYRDGVPRGDALPLSVSGILEEQEESHRFTLRAHDAAFVPEGTSEVAGRLYVVSADGNQTFIFRLKVKDGVPGLSPLSEYLPMRLFSGRGLVTGQGRLFYDLADGYIPLVAQRLPRYEPEAVLLTECFDSRLPGCVWHRLFLDAHIPEGTRVQVRSRAADTPQEVERTPFQLEPEPYLRTSGSELPFTPRPSGEHRGTWELLFQHPRGRYLQLELTLRGPGGATPRLHALRAYYPRPSYPERYLPAIYRQEPASASFLERFLANMEGFYTHVEDRIAAAQVLLDARTAPAEALEWLASWFGLALDPSWDEQRRRLLLRHAADFFRWRGTPRGLRMALRLVLDEPPGDALFQEEEDPLRASIRIIEHFRSAQGAQDRPGAAHRFTVFLPVPRGTHAAQLGTRLEQARRLVEQEKPAHTVFDVRFYWAMFRVGEARLGVDTHVSLGARAPEARSALVLGSAYLAEAFLTPNPARAATERWCIGRDRLTHHSTPGGDIR